MNKIQNLSKCKRTGTMELHVCIALFGYVKKGVDHSRTPASAFFMSDSLRRA